MSRDIRLEQASIMAVQDDFVPACDYMTPDTGDFKEVDEDTKTFW